MVAVYSAIFFDDCAASGLATTDNETIHTATHSAETLVDALLYFILAPMCLGLLEVEDAAQSYRVLNANLHPVNVLRKN